MCRVDATLYTWTIAVQPFHPFYVDRIPYIVATVELDEEPGLMFMTQLTDCTEDDLRIGMPVEVTFVELSPRAHAAVLPSRVEHRGRCLMATGQRVAIVGCGYSHVGRNTGLSIDDHMIQATKAALADAGLGVADIDGITSVGTEPLNDAWLLGIEPVNWWASGMMAPAFSYSATQAIAAVASGFCHTALALRVIGQQPSASALVKGAACDHPMTSMLHRAAGDRQFIVPFGAGSPVQWAGMFTQRYMQQYGATEEQFGRHVITQRYHASMNDDAIFREPITMDDYLAARYVSKPLRILDCDYPVDSGVGGDLHHRGAARATSQQPVVLVESYALQRDPRPALRGHVATWCTPRPCRPRRSCGRAPTSRPPTSTPRSSTTASRSSCSSGSKRSGSAVRARRARSSREGNTRLGGSLPVNTDGGACNVGRRHGANFCIESTRQLRGGQSGERQVDGAEVAVWTNAVGPFSAGAILTKG